MSADVLRIGRYSAEDVRLVVRELLDVYEAVYADKLDDPFFTTDRYEQRLHGYANRDGFAMVTGRLDGQLIGYALGYRLPATTSWWQGLTTKVAPQMTHETGSRTFGLNEIMVLTEHRRQGYARLLHDHLMFSRPVERRVALLVEPDNEPALAAYFSWDYRVVGDLQPFPDAPVYLAMIKDPL